MLAPLLDVRQVAAGQDGEKTACHVVIKVQRTGSLLFVGYLGPTAVSVFHVSTEPLCVPIQTLTNVFADIERASFPSDDLIIHVFDDFQHSLDTFGVPVGHRIETGFEFRLTAPHGNGFAVVLFC